MAPLRHLQNSGSALNFSSARRETEACRRESAKVFP